MLEILKDEGGPIEERVARYRGENRAAGRWAAGYGAIRHSVETRARVFAPAEAMASPGVEGDGVLLSEALLAADRVAGAAMWLVVLAT